MKRIIVPAVLVVFFSIPQQSNAQLKEADYRKQAAEVRNYVWGLKIKAFDERNIPAEYSKYSKVIIAKHEEITGLAKSRFRWMSSGPKKELTYTHTTRELVKINDAAALEDYSEITFQKFAQRYKDKLTTYLGVRVIKTDGTVKEVDPDEMILTDNTDKNKKGKLAVSDLQIGDMLDYFIQTVEFYESGGSLDFENFVFANENPMMHYSVHVEASKKLAVEYRAMNGAPDFKMRLSEDDDNLLDAEQKNIAPFPTSLWMSPYRQIPLIRFHMVLGNSLLTVRQPGEVYKNPDADEVTNNYDQLLKSYVSSARSELGAYDKQVKRIAESYLAQNGGGKIKDNPAALYYAARHHFLMGFSKEDVSVVNNNRNQRSPSDLAFLSMLEELFNQFDINSQFILLPSKYGPKANEIMNTGDLQLALMTDDSQVFTAESIFETPNVVPYYLEGQQGVTLDYHFSFRQAKSDKGSYTTKYSAASQNQHTEDLVFNFNPAEPQKIKVDRKATVTGLLRLDYQRQLLLYEDLYEEERKALGVQDSFYEILKDSKKGKKIIEEYQHAFDEARKEWKESFKDEIADQFDVKPEELISFKIDQSGVFEDKKAMIFSEQFTVNAWVKKAGNNYILDAGKMIGEQLKIKPEQRERKVDVYMTNARTFHYNVTIPVPQGYTAEGLDKLNTSIDNSTGSFVTTAKLDGSNVKITVTKVYKNAFEKAEKWPDLLKMLDAAVAYEELKIMFKKS